MGFFQTTELAVPFGQMVLVLIISSACFLFRRVRMGLLINYLFTLYWGFLCNGDLIASHSSNAVLLPTMYFGLEIALVVIAVIAFFSKGQ